MANDLLARYEDTVPEISETDPTCWKFYLQDHSPMQRRIARAVLDLYDGSAARVAKLLGIPPGTVNRHVQHPVMRWMLGERKPRIVPEYEVADREERAQALTTIMRSTQLDVKDRLKALELLGKMNADYTDKLEVKGEITTLHELVRSLAEEPPPRLAVTQPGLEDILK
jgi:hypothetical protein